MIERDNSVVVTTFVRFLVPTAQLFGLYVLAHGHESPGGGFQAGVILAAAYVLWMVQRTTQGTPNPELNSVRAMRKDLSLRESIVVAPLIALLLVLGFYPKPLLDVINPAIAATMADLGVQDPGPETPSAANK